MPMFVSINGILIITVFTLLLSSSISYSKLSLSMPVPSINTLPETSESFLNTSMEIITNQTMEIINDDTTIETKYPNRFGRNFQDTSNFYSVHELDQNYGQQDNFNYEQFQSTSPDVLSSVMYPLLTTSKPKLYHTIEKYRPQVLKVQIKPVKKMPNGSIKSAEFSNEDNYFDSEMESDFVPLASLYGTGAIHKWSEVPAHDTNTNPGKSYTAFGTSSIGYDSYGQNGFEFSSGIGSALDNIQDAISHHVPIIAEMHSKPPKPKLDLKKIGILALVKIGLAKLKAFGVLKILFFLLLKFKLFLLAIFIKFLLFLKALKLLKALMIPFLLLSLLPLLLLLLPLLFLPLLLPLLLLLPVPVVSPVGKRIEVFDYIKTQKSDPVLEIVAQVLDSEHCIERIACQLATKKESKFLYPAIDWYLSKLSSVIHNEKIISYIEAYLKSVKEYNGNHTDFDGEKWCSNNYPCVKSEISGESGN